MRSILVFAALLVLMPAAAQVYKWTDSTGKTHYGDSPPEGTKTDEIKIRIPSYEGPPKVTDWAAVIRRPSAVAGPQGRGAMPQGLTMYSTAWCGVCKRAKSYFAAKGIRYTEIDIEKSEAGMRQYEQLGVRGVPAIVVGSKVMTGFSEEALQALLKS